ncbi:aldo/keto reductase [Alphaproteobacteria bacterium]|nr:aldo/keto reductase [Alphaproteobacteria bacterium]
MELFIGTAQFGFKYGFNKIKIKKLEIKNIEKILKRNSLKNFDTAMNYGESEKIIGNLKIKRRVITKVKLPKKKPKDLKKWFEKKLNKSLKKLKVKSLHGLLIHDTTDISGKNKEFLNILLDCQKKKLISKLGISVYEVGEIKRILKFWKPEIIQMPINIFDHRFLNNNFLYKLKKLNIELHARSCFLQGVLLKKKIKIGNLKSKKVFSSFSNWCQKKQLSKLEACIHFIKKIKEIDYLIVGFDNSSHLKEIINSFNKKLILVPDDFLSNEKSLIDPRKWKIN